MSKFKVYEFSFEGLWLPAGIIVISVNREFAEQHAQQQVAAMGYPDRPVEFVKEYPVEEGSIVYQNDGDY